jgi:hypothetical protein
MSDDNFFVRQCTQYRDIKNYLGQRWSWFGKRPSQLISCDDFFGTNDWPTYLFYESQSYSEIFSINSTTLKCGHMDQLYKNLHQIIVEVMFTPLPVPFFREFIFKTNLMRNQEKSLSNLK